MLKNKKFFVHFEQIHFLPKIPAITGIGREQITFSSLETQIANDNEIRFNRCLCR